MFKTNLPGHNKIWKGTKKFGGCFPGLITTLLAISQKINLC